MMQPEYSGSGAARPAITRRRAFGIVARGAALGALSAGAVVTLSPPPAEAVVVDDALFRLVAEYRAKRDTWNNTEFVTDQAGDDALDRDVKPLRDQLMRHPPLATTEAGAVAAVQFVQERMVQFASEDYSLTLAAALAFYDGRRSR